LNTLGGGGPQVLLVLTFPEMRCIAAKGQSEATGSGMLMRGVRGLKVSGRRERRDGGRPVGPSGGVWTIGSGDEL